MGTIAKAIPRLAATAMFALALAGPIAGSAPATVWNARMQFPAAAPPTAAERSSAPSYLYLQLDTAGELRIAGSAAALASARPLKARENSAQDLGSKGSFRDMVFAQASLPVSLEGVESVETIVSFHENRHRRDRRSPMVDEATLSVKFAVAKRDRASTKWIYIFSVITPLKANLPPDHAPVIKVPDLQDLKLTIGTYLEGRKAGIGLELKAGTVVADKVLVEPKKATCTLEVLDASGQVLHSAKGDLETFGFT